MEIDWTTKFLIKFFPKLFLRRAAKKQGLDSARLDLAENLFRSCQRIDIQPLAGGSRGFILTLDNKLTLWFYQDGDHFVYDGYEIGQYENGEVTVFDSLKR